MIILYLQISCETLIRSRSRQEYTHETVYNYVDRYPASSTRPER